MSTHELNRVSSQRELLQFRRLILDKEVLLLNMQMDMSRYGEFRMDYNSLITDLDRAIEQQYALLCKHENNQTESKTMKDIRNDKIVVLLSPEEILKFIEAANAYDQSLASAVRYLDAKYSEYCRATDEAYRNECLAEQARIKKECTQAALSNYAHSVEQTYNP